MALPRIKWVGLLCSTFLVTSSFGITQPKHAAWFSTWGKPLSSVYDSIINAEKAGKLGKQAQPSACLCKSAVANTSTLIIRGKCYEGPDTTHPINSGTFKLCIKPVREVEKGFDYPCNWWSTTSEAVSIVTIQNGGNFTGSLLNVEKGQNYVLANPAPYILQWWDGSSIAEQPKPVSLTDDTINCEFHFKAGSAVSGKITLDPVSSVYFTGVAVELADTFGLQIGVKIYSPDTINTNTANFTIAAIPAGTYYLKQSRSDFGGVFCPGTETIDSGLKLTFDTTVRSVDSITWKIKNIVYTPRTSWDSITVVNPPAVTTGLKTTVLYLEMRGFEGYSNGSTSATLDVPTLEKFFLARASYSTDYTRVSEYWYPGTFFRAEAETLVVKPNEFRTITLPEGTAGTITGTLPKFSFKANRFYSLFYSPMLMRRGEQKSLGATVNVADPGGLTNTTGYFTIVAPDGSYSLWNVPGTQGYYRTEGWGAFSVDSIAIKNNSPVSTGLLTSTWNTRSIVGTVNCRLNPLLACFDTLGRPVSTASIDLLYYFWQMTGQRGRFFGFDLFPKKTYSVSFALNFLKPGRYAIAKVEPLDSVSSPCLISWYGGPQITKTFITYDDLTLLKVPSNVTWVTIDSANTVVTLPPWESSVVKQSTVKKQNQSNLKMRMLPNGNISISSQPVAVIITVRVLSLNGRVVGIFKIAKGQTISLNRNYMNKMLLFEIINGPSTITKAFFCR